MLSGTEPLVELKTLIHSAFGPFVEQDGSQGLDLWIFKTLGTRVCGSYSRSGRACGSLRDAGYHGTGLGSVGQRWDLGQCGFDRHCPGPRPLQLLGGDETRKVEPLYLGFGSLRSESCAEIGGRRVDPRM